jgi:hypothetical protein
MMMMINLLSSAHPFQVLSHNCEKRLLASSCPSVHPTAWKNSAPTGRILTKLDILDFTKICSEYSSSIKTRQEVTVTLHEDVFTFITIFRYILLRMRNVSEKTCIEN